MTTLTLRAPAKINLFLDILGKRPDGYHELRSLVAPVSVYDRIILKKTFDGIIQIQTMRKIRFPGIPWLFSIENGLDNLAAKAAAALQEASGAAYGVKINLHKHIPITSGLGGGSSDAAAVLRGLNVLWGINWPVKRLLMVAETIGCDVPALTLGRPVLMEGKGEKVTPLALPKAGPQLHLLLVNPGLAVSTADIYGRHTKNNTFGSTTSRFRDLVRGLRLGIIPRTGASLYNALEETVFRKYPLLAMLKEQLLKIGAEGAVLSGSGATILAMARNRAHALLLVKRLRSAWGAPLWATPAVIVTDAWARLAPGSGTARWCNGSTRPFGGQSLGSNPSRAIARQTRKGM